MKKLLLSLAIVGSMWAVSCTSTSTTEEKKDATEIVTALDSAKTEADAQTIVEKADAYAQKLIQDGKIQEAKNYIETVRKAVEAKYPKVASSLDKVTAALTTAENAIEAKDSLKAKADSLKDAAIDSVKSKAAEVADSAVSKVTNAAADKANDAVNAVKDKASDALKGLKK